MSTIARNIILFAGALLLLSLALPVSSHLMEYRERMIDRSEMTYFPSGRCLQELSLGHRHLVADIAWLSAIQYYGKHRQTDQNYEISPSLFSVITEADPAFINAYLFASLVMTEAGKCEQAEALLVKGADNNPDSWRLHFDLGFFHFVVTHSWEKAAVAFQASARAPGAPEYTQRFAAASLDKAGNEETARVLWQVIALESENEEIRRMAEERLSLYEQ